MKESGARLEISHLKSLGPANWGKVVQILDRMEKLKKGGYDIDFDQYPWDVDSTGLKATVPGWAYFGGVDDFEACLSPIPQPTRISTENAHILHNRGDGCRVIVASVPESLDVFSWMPGLAIDKIAKRLGMDEVTAVLRILSKTRSSVICIYRSINEEDIQAVMRSSYHVVCTGRYRRHSPPSENLFHLSSLPRPPCPRPRRHAV